MLFVQPPLLLRKIYSSLTWHIPVSDKTVFLTFDDGPIPETTPFILELLASYQIRATFFCIGDNIEKNPALYHQLKQDGHATGNHTHHHLNGWKTNCTTYVENVNQCAKHIPSRLFRPPYGKLTPQQIKALTPTFDIIMWDVLSYDFDASISPEQCLKNVINHVRQGSIIVFHDSIKSFRNMSYALPRTLEHLMSLGYRFDIIPPSLKQ